MIARPASPRIERAPDLVDVVDGLPVGEEPLPVELPDGPLGFVKLGAACRASWRDYSH